MPDIDPEEASRSSGAGKLSLFLLVLLIVALAIALPRLGGQALNPVASEAIGGPFTLVAADGSSFSEKNLAGKPFAIYFGYTRCPDVCPTSLARMARLRQQLGADGDKFEIVFISVDPERDKPAAIGEYVKLFGTPIIGLTGSEAQLRAMAHSYRIYVSKVPQPGGNYLVDHSAAILLMDGEAKLVGKIDHDEADPSALAKLKRLIA